jgi:hypothetical protein
MFPRERYSTHDAKDKRRKKVFRLFNKLFCICRSTFYHRSGGKLFSDFFSALARTRCPKGTFKCDVKRADDKESCGKNREKALKTGKAQKAL